MAVAVRAADLCYQKLVEHAASGRVEIVPESGLLDVGDPHLPRLVLSVSIVATEPDDATFPFADRSAAAAIGWFGGC